MVALAPLRRLASAGALALLATVAAAQTIEVGRFEPPARPDAPPPGWRALTFRTIARQTRYAVVKDGDGWVLRADADASASALYHVLDVDARAYPILSWRWKIAGVVAAGDATRRSGDDYAARVYVAFRYDSRSATAWERAKYGFLRALYGQYPPKVALNYVWDNRLPIGTVLDNAYTDRAKIVVTRSGDSEAGRWIAERRDIWDDYRRIVGGEAPRLAGVAVMTDTDDTGGRATAWYADITLSAR